MSDVPEGPAWWQASDGRWYPPEQFGQTAGTAAPAQPQSPPLLGAAPAPPPAPSPSPAMPTAPMPGANAGGAPVLCTVGDIAVTGTEVHTPAGSIPLRNTTWMVSNMTTTTSGIPTWAIVMAILFAVLCLLGLLFLLVKEERTTGVMQVAVQADGFYHATQIPVGNVAAVADVENRVNYIRSLVASAP
ncbi:MAG: hypothetical protein KDB36_11845 [Acidimicrobiales bacterium]|nr:hypothetical protein [Acidimicrobiales bacterium]